MPLMLAALSLLGTATVEAKSAVVGLQCEYLENPLGIDTARPRLSWRLESDERGQKQTAYQLLVAGNAAELAANHGDLWDSGKVASDESVQIEYAGKPLGSRQQCFWKVRVWDKEGNISQSETARWEMGLLQPHDWQAKWIGRTTNSNITVAPLLRRGFHFDGRIRQARAYVCGLGYFELYLNGRRVGDHWLDPGYTRYDRRALYLAYDVTGLLKRGENVAGAILGNGWFNVSNKAAWDFDRAPWRAAPRLLCQIEVEFTDGRRTVIASDADWKSAESPIVYNTIYSGEIYDARREQAGWDRVGFDDSKWSPVLLVEPPKGVLSAQMMPAIKTDRVLEVQKITEPKPGVYVFDFGQNLTGHADLEVRGPAGARVEMKYAERLATNGLVDQAAIAQHLHRFDAHQLFQTDTYILKGRGLESWHSRFSYSGFRYVQVTGLPARPDKDSLRAVFFHSAVPVAGHFECSNPLLNRIEEATRWSYLGNLQGIPTDCPHREKNGWTGDAHLAAEQAMFNYFPPAVYAKWIQDLGDEQRPDGRLPGIVPTGGWGYQWGNGPAWDSAFLLIPYYQYLYYGDTELFRRHYDGMKRYVDYLTSRAKDGIVKIGLNDWAPFKTKTEAGITDTAYYYVDTKIVALAAQCLGQSEEARRYTELAANTRQAFNDKFYHPDTGLYDNRSQTALSCALYQGLVEPDYRSRVLTNLVAAVECRDWHIDTGILGAKYLLNTLTENGRADVAYRIASQKDLPSWGWWIEQGATTLWEEWNGDASRFHIMYGDISAWFYKAICGINPDPASPGFKHFFIKPNVVGDLTFARGEYDSIRGRIVSDWKLVKGEFQLDLALPANTSATVSLPVCDASQVRESGKVAANAPGVEVRSGEGQCAVFEVGAGSHHFRGPLAR
jgi:alpha-L-rhamnosidase